MVRQLVIDGDHVVTEPLCDEADDILDAYFRDHRDELDALLQPFGLTMTDIQKPEFRTFVYESASQG